MGMLFIIIVLIVLAVIIILSRIFKSPVVSKDNVKKIDSEIWRYGDAWKKGSPDDSAYKDETPYSEILRVDTGKGYDDSYMLDLIIFLGSKGIKATYDSFALGIETAGIKTYILKVEVGREDEARKYLKESGA